MRIALAGTGAFGIKHLDGLQNIDGVSVTAVVSRRLEQAEEVARKYGVPRATTSLDEVLGDHQTVIKNLGRFYRHVQFISGATILGDGTVALILDPDRVIQDVTRAKAAVQRGSWCPPPPACTGRLPPPPPSATATSRRITPLGG